MAAKILSRTQPTHIARVNRTAPTGSTLSLSEARRIALCAQGFDAPSKAERPSRAVLNRAIKKIGLLQLDSVNVLVRSHYLPLFSRLGPYDVAALDTLSQRKPRGLFEYWGHEASLIPIDLHHLFRWRMARARSGDGLWGGPSKLAKDRPEFVKAVLNEIADRGPIGAGELTGGGKSTGNWWGWSEGKRALEYLFWTGQVTSAGRRGFERLYDLPERVIPQKHLVTPCPGEANAQRRLIEIAASALGVATESDLRDYFRLPVADTKARIAELVEEGTLRLVAVEDWKQQAYLHCSATAPASIEASALISPFDSLIWMRPRTERLFGFHYRLAFYTPKHKRTEGYYVMPLLEGDRLVARVDLKSDRKGNALQVLGGQAEHGVRTVDIAGPLRKNLDELASWLGLEHVAVKSRTELPKAVRRA